MKEYTLQSVFDFGKYRGKTVLEVIRTDPSYVEWCILEVENFRMRPESLSDLQINHPYGHLHDTCLQAFYSKSAELFGFYDEEA